MLTSERPPLNPSEVEWGGIPLALVSACLSLAGCSFILDNFHQCNVDSDCPSTNQVCQSNYCVAVPAGCVNGVPDAGIQATYGLGLSTNPIHLGALFSLTNAGIPSATHIQDLNALTLALTQINQLQVGGRTFVLHVCDTTGDNKLAASQADWMINKVGVPAIVVPVSSTVLAVAPGTLAAGVLLMSPTATSVEITGLSTNDGGPRLVWRTVPSDTIQAQVISELILGKASFDAGLAGSSPIGIIYENDAYGQGLESTLIGLLGSPGPGVQFAAQYTRDGPITTAVGQLAGVNPRLSINISYPEDVPRILDAGLAYPSLLRDAGNNWFFTDSAKDPQIIANSPPFEINGSYGTAPAQGAGVAFSVFRTDFLSAFPGVDPSNYSYTANSFDAMYCLALAAGYAEGLPGAVTGPNMARGMTMLSLDGGTSYVIAEGNFTQAVSTLQAGTAIDINGASGPLNFNPATGEAPAPIELWQVVNGGFTTAAVISP